jgi:hypothetical protein
MRVKATSQVAFFIRTCNFFGATQFPLPQVSSLSPSIFTSPF